MNESSSGTVTRDAGGNSEEVAAFFEERALGYDHKYEVNDGDGHALRARMAAVMALLRPAPGDVLDAGMGPGRLLTELERSGWTVFGVDSTAAMVRIARERLPRARERLLQADIEGLPFPDASFDAAVATGVLEYADTASAVGELARVLRAGGQAIVSYPNPSALYGIWKTRLYYPAVRAAKRLLKRGTSDFPRAAKIISPTEFEALLRERGLDVETRVFASYLPTITPLDAVFPRLTARLGERLEGSGDRLGRMLATQIVFSARKR